MESSPSAETAIETCLQILETYADLESLISLSQTCHSMRHLLVDNATHEVKISHFEIESFPIPHASSLLPTSPEQNWRTASARVPHYLTRALIAIHFPSLRRLHLDFPLTRRRNLHVVEDVSYAAFPVFVTNLGYACNLEYLHLDVGRLMAIERTGQLEAIYEVFGQNIQRCTKLRELSIRNVGVDRCTGPSLYSVALLQALIPLIALRKDDLLTIKVSIARTPSDPIYYQQLSQQGVDVKYDFFVAILSVSCLETLEVDLNSVDHLNALIRAVRCIQESHLIKKPSKIKNLKICHHPEEHGDTDFSMSTSAIYLLDIFSECYELKHLRLELPLQYWGEGYTALKKLLFSKHDLESLSLCFSCYQDVDGKMMTTLVDFCQESLGYKALKELSLFGLFGIKPESFLHLEDVMADMGLSISRRREKSGEISTGIDLLICSFVRACDTETHESRHDII
ncbi:hypothetical protein HJC23_008060 [Cyclotella cryptica]|uniref:F-box domain-containing protein n=1 Tax=Cyclotella cryptica TaxID=29204 RepID=A0ABD3NV38_9STRA|eukprot:CCRYP_019799-RA/>CCRYP_019799-RA protein AED:0.25 eAED:0.25 QI:0/-1/0/1/-1/1/1/0/454